MDLVFFHGMSAVVGVTASIVTELEFRTVIARQQHTMKFNVIEIREIWRSVMHAKIAYYMDSTWMDNRALSQQ